LRRSVAGTIDGLRARNCSTHQRDPAWKSVSGHRQRVWELRGQITAYDASYIAVAEFVGVPLLTLDDRLRRAKGPRCSFLDL
jgi:predicted nucleic acid-binding protein